MTPSSGRVAGPPDPDVDPYDLGHGTATLHVEHYDLDLRYRVRTNRLAGTARLRIRTREDVREIRLDLGALAVSEVAVTGATVARHRHRAGRLVVRLDDVVPAGTLLEVLVRYSGTPTPVASPWGTVGWEELEDGVVVASQPTGAPSWFPCNDRPGDKSTYRTSVTVENPYVALAHGTLVRQVAGAGTTTWVFDEPHPTAAYLATVQVGRYTRLTLASEPVPQVVLVPPALVAAARSRLGRHAEIMRLFVDLFGPYPFDGYTLVVTPDVLEIPVEAQGMAIFGSNHLRPGGDGDRLVPHELAHQWFGNSVSVSSWQHIWLNEGFAAYAEWVWSEASGGPTADALAADHRARLAGLPQDLVLADPGAHEIFDDRVYKRGALTLHALRRTVGDDAFWGLVRAWTARHAGGSATTAAFRVLAHAHALRAGGPDLARRADVVLTAWLDRAPLPPLPAPTGEGGTGPGRLATQLRCPPRTGTPS